MGVGIFNKIKNAFKTLGGKVKSFATNAIKVLPKVIDTGSKLLNKAKPILGNIPLVGDFINGASTALNTVNTIGKSLMNET